MTDVAWLEFTPLMSSEISKQEVIEKALDLSTDIDDVERKLQCQTILVALSLKFNVEINDELGRKIRMSPLGQKIYNEGVEEGRVEGKAEILIKQLVKRFKFVPDNYKDKILMASQETVESIAMDIFDLDKVEDLGKYF